MVAHARLLDEAEAARDGSTTNVSFITTYFDTIGCKRTEGIMCQELHCFCHVSMPLSRDTQPVADFKVPVLPVLWMDAGTS